MCGIIGAISSDQVQPLLLHALKCMEYRGYDSAGVCIQLDGAVQSRKAEGKLSNLEALLQGSPLHGHCGIGHTRWATHGAPSVENAHPHSSNAVTVVHNGIIENFVTLKEELTSKGAVFKSETDTEVIPWLFESELQCQSEPMLAWQATLRQLHGAYAINAMVHAQPGIIWFARKGSPMLLAKAAGLVMIASDALAVAGVVDEVMYLEEGDWGCISRKGITVHNSEGEPVERMWKAMPSIVAATDKGPYAHYMLKEIHEQPQVMRSIYQAYVHYDQIQFSAAEFLDAVELPQRIVMVACGTSYHAALTARYWLERYLQISVEVDVASEYRYRDPVIGENTWLITLSQSGETADTLEALRLFKRQTPNNKALAICNVGHSSLVRESDGVIELLAGPEIGVASTKAYTAQLMVLILLSLKLARKADGMSESDFSGHLEAVRKVPADMELLLANAAEVESLAPIFMQVFGALFLGRGPCYPLALEGALKLKEISYLHAEGYAAGEMKHGPIALIDSNLPVIVLALKQYHLDKVLSNLQEVKARGAITILLTDLSEAECPNDVVTSVHIPEGDYFTAPLLASIPLQLLAYYVARAKGTDVDQPRNLAKSVTVE